MEKPIFMVIFLIAVITAFILRRKFYKKSIYRKVESMGGKVLSIERRSFFTGLGPFVIVGKGKSVYRFDYLIHEQKRIGFVCFGGFFGPDWRFE